MTTARGRGGPPRCDRADTRTTPGPRRCGAGWPGRPPAERRPDSPLVLVEPHHPRPAVRPVHLGLGPLGGGGDPGDDLLPDLRGPVGGATLFGVLSQGL